MKQGAEKEAAAKGATLMSAAGATDGDNEGQVTLIENMVNAGVKGILITPECHQSDCPRRRGARRQACS